MSQRSARRQRYLMHEQGRKARQATDVAGYGADERGWLEALAAMEPGPDDDPWAQEPGACDHAHGFIQVTRNRMAYLACADCGDERLGRGIAPKAEGCTEHVNPDGDPCPCLGCAMFASGESEDHECVWSPRAECTGDYITCGCERCTRFRDANGLERFTPGNPGDPW